MPASSRWTAALLGVVVGVGCGDDGRGPIPDSSTPDAGEDGGVGIAPAALPTIAIAKGRYPESNTIDGGPITLWGACPSETILTTGITPAATVLRFESMGHAVHNVSVGFQPPRSGLVIVDASVRAPLEEERRTVRARAAVAATRRTT